MNYNTKGYINMNKPELVAQIADKNNLTKKQTEQIFDSFVETLFEGLNEDGKVNITGFGIFEIKETAQRVGRNPRTGEELVIPAKKSVAFRVSKALKENLDVEE